MLSFVSPKQLDESVTEFAPSATEVQDWPAVPHTLSKWTLIETTLVSRLNIAEDGC